MERMQTTKLRNNTFTQLLAIGGLAIGVATSIPAAPAQAVLLNTGQIAFQGGTGNFFEDVVPGVGDTFSVNFNPLGQTFVSQATGSFTSSFPLLGSNAITPSTGNFTYTALNSTPTSFNYTLNSNLPFNFTNFPDPVNLTIGAGSTFNGSLNTNGGLNFRLTNSIGSSFSNASGSVIAPVIEFGFGDIPGGNGGGYQLASTPVPEPFTIIGTIVGGTAAFRMRKKLSAGNKK
jgi:hypothetical protein